MSSIILGFSDGDLMRYPWTPMTPSLMSPGPGRRSSVTKPPPSRIVFSWHGDIKPTNLLWFPDPTDSNGKGTIKICHFGAGEFSTDASSPSSSDSISHTPPYRLPESDLPDFTVTNSYDVWTLGCLYFEFVTWFMGGFNLVEDFKTHRGNSSSSPCRTNAFFEILRDPESHEVIEPQQARVKPAVSEPIQKLRDHPRHSAFFENFLDMIQNRMLIINPNRMSCHYVYMELGGWIEKCEAHPAYALGPFRPNRAG